MLVVTVSPVRMGEFMKIENRESERRDRAVCAFSNVVLV